MATHKINQSLSFTRLLELAHQLPNEKKQALITSLGNDLVNEAEVPNDVKKMLTERLKYFKTGKAKTYTLEQTLKMLNEK